MNKRNQRRLRLLRSYLRQNSVKKIRKFLKLMDFSEIPEIIGFLEPEELKALFSHLDPEEGAEIIRVMDANIESGLLQEMNRDKLIKILEAIPPDDATDILQYLPSPQRERILQLMKGEEAQDIKTLIQYPEDTAGGKMTTDFIALPENLTTDKAIEELRKRAKEVEDLSTIYITDDKGILKGVLSLKELIVSPPHALLKEVMNPRVVSVRPELDQEEVADIVATYDLLSLPVTDEQKRLLGVITVDDVIDVIEEEATEDIYKMAGTAEEELVSKTPLKGVAARLPWLTVCLFTGFISAVIIRFFKPVLGQVIALAAFIPVIMDMGGNVGVQSSTIMVRGMATGYIDLSRIKAILLKEIKIGILLGLICGLGVGIFASFFWGEPGLGIVVGLAMVCALSVAAFAGMFFPVVFTRFHIDPAVACGPFITSVTDITGLLIYFNIALLMIKFMGLK